MSDLAPSLTIVDELTVQEAAVLAFEDQLWRSMDAKAQAVKDAFGWSLTQHQQYLNHLIDLPAALVARPMLVGRLRRLRDRRRNARSVRRLA